jgi:hypothetical protein
MTELHDHDYNDWPFHHGRHHRHHRHHHHPRPALLVWVVDRQRQHHEWVWRYRIYPLSATKETCIMTEVTVGHIVTDTIVYLDKAGNPMLTPQTPDSAPTWTKTADDSVDTLAASGDGSTATISAVAAGQDTVTLTVIVGGQTFTATQQLNITDAAQVLTSVAIEASVA